MRPAQTLSNRPRRALLIRCSVADANRIRAGARIEDRTISGYVLHVLRRTWPAEDRLRESFEMVRGLNMRATARATKPAEEPVGPRTALLIRCSHEEAARIRGAARRRRMNLNNYVLHALRRNWRVHDHLQEKLEEFRRTRLAANSAVLSNAERSWPRQTDGGKRRPAKTQKHERPQ